MSVKTFAIAAFAGYVLGARAGRKRYDQIVRISKKVWKSSPVQSGVSKAKEAAGAAASEVKDHVPFGHDEGDDPVEVRAVDF